tara:strand:+ start:5155 stop:5643 length:489 start_codon:yes stop_codon:yes gene_type:complete
MDENTCMICNEEYDAKNKAPQILIPCGHNICKFCIMNLNSNKCPYCLTNILTFAFNRSLLNYINFHKLNYDTLKKELEKKNKLYDILINKINSIKDHNNRLSLQLFKLKIEFQIQKNNILLDKKKKNLSEQEISLYYLNDKNVNRMINTYDQINRTSYNEVI